MFLLVLFMFVNFIPLRSCLLWGGGGGGGLLETLRPLVCVSDFCLFVVVFCCGGGFCLFVVLFRTIFSEPL